MNSKVKSTHRPTVLHRMEEEGHHTPMKWEAKNSCFTSAENKSSDCKALSTVTSPHQASKRISSLLSGLIQQFHHPSTETFAPHSVVLLLLQALGLNFDIYSLLFSFLSFVRLFVCFGEERCNFFYMRLA